MPVSPGYRNGYHHKPENVLQMPPDSWASFRELCLEVAQNKPTLPEEASVACVDTSTALLWMRALMQSTHKVHKSCVWTSREGSRCNVRQPSPKKVPEFGEKKKKLPALSSFEAPHGPACPIVLFMENTWQPLPTRKSKAMISVTTGALRKTGHYLHIKEILTPTPPQGSLTNTEVSEPGGEDEGQKMRVACLWEWPALRACCGHGTG